MQGHLCDRQQFGWCSNKGAKDHFKEPYQVCSMQGLLHPLTLGAAYSGRSVQSEHADGLCMLLYVRSIFMVTTTASTMGSCCTNLECHQMPVYFPCSIIFCEAVAIYGVIVAIILQTKLEGVTREEGLYSKSNMAAGYAIFGAGLTCGLSNLVCG